MADSAHRDDETPGMVAKTPTPGTSSGSTSSGRASPFNLKIRIPSDDERGPLSPGFVPVKQLQTPLTMRPPQLKRLASAADDTSDLHNLARQQDVEGLRRAVEDRTFKSINSADEDGYTALMVAAALDAEAAPEMVRILLAGNAALERVDREGFTAMHWAAAVGHVGSVRALHARGANANATSEDGDTPLHRAAMLGRAEAVEVLVKQVGADAMKVNRSFQLPQEVACSLLDATGKGADAGAVRRAREKIVRVLLEGCPDLRCTIFYHQDCLAHIAGTPHQESPRRLDAILDGVRGDAVFEIDAPLSEGEAAPGTGAGAGGAAGAGAGAGAGADGRGGGGGAAANALRFCTDFPLASIEAVARVHSRPYVNFVKHLADELGPGQAVPFTPRVQRECFGIMTPRAKPEALCDTAFGQATLQAALRACGAATAAVDSVFTPGKGRSAFCVVRPPGHHAGVSGLPYGMVPQVPDGESSEAPSCGFCIFNTVCVAAAHALQGFDVRRVAIVDVDVHHGNGTEEIVDLYNRTNVSLGKPPPVFLASSHLYNRAFYPGTGKRDEIDSCCMNLPLHPLWEKRHHAYFGIPADDYGRAGWRRLVKERLVFALRCFQPDLILVSCGFDGAKGDIGNKQGAWKRAPIGLDLLPKDFRWLATQLRKVAKLCCDGRIVAVLEGGYGNVGSSPASDANTGSSQSSVTLEPPENLALGNFSHCAVQFIAGLSGMPPATEQPRPRKAHPSSQSQQSTPASADSAAEGRALETTPPADFADDGLTSPSPSTNGGGSPVGTRKRRSRTPPQRVTRPRR